MAKKKYYIPKKKLIDLYYKQKLSIFKIAEIYKCTGGTIIYRMKKYNIRRRHSGPKRINITKETLYSLYIQKGFSARKIARISHCEQTAILNKLRKYNIPIKHFKKIDLIENDLRKLYIKQKLSTYKIAKKFNCNAGTIYRYLKFYKIKTRPLKRLNLTKSELEKLYNNQTLSLKKIARIYKCCPVAILKKMKKYKIPRRTISETSTKYIKNNFSGNLLEKSYLIGFRLGDLGVRKPKNLIHVGCGTTKLEQIQLIKSLFKSYGPIWISNKNNKRKAFHIDCSLNSSFSFLLPKHDSIPRWIIKNKRNFFSFLAGYTDAEGNISISQGRAKFRIRSYDKKILKDIDRKLKKLNIKSRFNLDRKAGIDKRGVIYNKDTWSLIVQERKSLFILFNYLICFLKHKKRKKDLQKSLQNVIIRNKKFGDINL